MAREVLEPWRTEGGPIAQRHSSGSFVALGIGLIAAGIVSTAAAYFATMAWVVVVGFALLFAGVFTVIEAVVNRGFRDALPSTLLGALYGIMGLLFIVRPGVGSAALTLLITAMFFISGLVRMASAMMLRYPKWGWGLASGVVSAVLGLILFGMWPTTSIWLIGTLVGIELIFAGVTSIGIARTLRPDIRYERPAPRKEPRPPSRPDAQPPIN